MSAPPPPLACTVRGCGLPLDRQGPAFVCARGHLFDVARTGRVTLLQPQDRRSTMAGDTADAVAARARLLEAGIGRGLIDAVVSRVAALSLPDVPVVADLGCGTGDTLRALGAALPITGIGIDLSVAAIDHAARLDRAGRTSVWVVANADRRLPLLDGSVDLVLSLHGRRNAPECARILRPGGIALVAVPASDDLIELRTRVAGQATVRERQASVQAEYVAHLHVVAQETVTTRHDLTRPQLIDLLRATYRGARHRAANAVATLDHLSVTLSSTLFQFTTPVTLG